MFCTYCGEQIEDSVNFCPYCGSKLASLDSTQQKKKNSTSTGNNQTQKYEYLVYEKFSPALGLGKSFIITDRSLIISGVEYMYTDMQNISLVNPPSTMVNGVAQTYANGKRLTLAFTVSDSSRFMKFLEYANGQIDKAHGTERKYKYVIQSSLTARVEVYEDYVIIYVLKAGILATLGNSFAGGTGGCVVYFSDLEVLIESGCLRFVINSIPLDIRLNEENSQTADDIVEHIINKKNTMQNDPKTASNEKWDNFVGESKEFPIEDKTFVVSKEMDLFNKYRLKFRELASDCAENTKKEISQKVQNLVTYIEFCPQIYEKHLDIMVNKAIDILVAEEVWTVTHDSFIDEHKKSFHFIQDEFDAMAQCIQLAIQKNKKSVASITGLVPNLVGGGFGIKGAMKGVAKATAFNIVRDTAEASLINNASQVNQTQQNELYGRLNFDNWCELAFIDYWRVYLTLAYTLKNEGKHIWIPSKEDMDKASNIFENLSNPNFPEERKLEMFLEILKTNPYKQEYQKYMTNQWGETEQTTAIKNYFGFYDFNNTRMQ